jgi:hypothetical protein
VIQFPGDPEFDAWLIPFLDDIAAGILPHVVSLEEWFKFLVGAGPMPGGPPPPPPDPRTPIQQLLESYLTVEEKQEADAVAHWNDSSARQAVHDAVEAVAGAIKDARAMENPANQQTAGDAVVGAVAASQDPALRVAEAAANAAASATDKVTPPVDADVHVSDSAPIFPNWHIPPDKLAGDFTQPLTVPITDQAILDAIAANRKLLPVIPQGSLAPGYLSWQKYSLRGTEGWMFKEDDKSEYGKWVIDQLAKVYAAEKDKAAPVAGDPSKSATDKAKALAPQRLAAACIAVKEQEGAPSAINTWDGQVLSWGIGISGPGKLPETFARIVQSRRVKKALYLCGFLYQGTVVGNQHHGGYQIVDLPSKQVFFKDNFFHDTAGTHKKGDYEGLAFVVLKLLVTQIEMLHLLIQLARDPLTRETILAPNYDMIRRFSEIANPEELNSEAIYVFAAQVRHNWGLPGDIVKWAKDHFNPTERATPTPSVARDVAIAKGICRRIASLLQRQRWKISIQLAEAGKITMPFNLWERPAQTEWELSRLREKYLLPLISGTKTQDGSSVAVTGFLDPSTTEPTSAPADHYVTQEFSRVPGSTGPWFDVGPQGQCDLLFPHDRITVVRFDSGNVVIRDVKTGVERTVTKAGAPP